MSDNPKYSKALALFRDTDLTRKEICELCNLTVGEFNVHLQRHHRDLLLKKTSHGTDTGMDPATKLHGKQGQGVLSKEKYRDAILACRDLKFITYNISEIARHFKLNPTGLGNQLRAHYPDILEWRYKEQESRGITSFRRQASQDECREQYASAIERLRDTDDTLKEVAEKCGVSFSGFRQHVLFYHKDLVRRRRKNRKKNEGQKYMGKKTGRNTIHQPNEETIKKYAEALEMYQSTPLTIKDIVAKTGVPYSGFSSYIRTWHRDLIEKRRGIKCKEDVELANFNHYKQYLASTSFKYEKAIRYLKRHNVTTAAAARQYSLHPETFRMYLKEHEPELAESHGMMHTEDGKYVSRRSYEKYKEAMEVYRTTPDSLKSIATRFGLNAMSFGGFIRRNYPEYIAQHKKARLK